MDERRNMSTSYFISTSNKRVKEKYFSHYEFTDEPKWGYEIEIASITAGWMPIFYPQEKAFKSYKELKLLVATKKFVLYDEYLTILTWEQFDNEIQKFMNKKNELQSYISDEFTYSDKWYRDSEGYEFHRLF